MTITLMWMVKRGVNINVYEDYIKVNGDMDVYQGVGALVPGDPRRRICEQRKTPIGES